MGGNSIEKEDRKKVAQIRNAFYQMNEKFERLLKFKPFSKIKLWTFEFNLMSTYNIFASMRIDQRTYSLEDQIKKIEQQLDLRDYYDIKRPTVIFFSNHGDSVKGDLSTGNR